MPVGVTGSDVERLFRDSGALLDGHFVRSSGRHAPQYLEKFQVLQWPKRTERLCAEIALRVRPLAAQTVAGPTTIGEPEPLRETGDAELRRHHAIVAVAGVPVRVTALNSGPISGRGRFASSFPRCG